MRILITNDDGIHAPGLRAMVDVARRLGEVVVAAPDRERSACGHAMTMRDPLRVHPVPMERVRAYQVNGVPADCVNVGLTVGWPDGCDLVLSGINNGPNLGFDVTYSGTVAGAMEGAINGIRSIAVSMALLDYGQHIDYGIGAGWLHENLAELIALPLPELVFLNINVPNHAVSGARWVGMGKRIYKDRVEMREDPWGNAYYWQGGTAVIENHPPHTDVDAVRHGYVSITPISLDWTDHTTLRHHQTP